MFTRLSLERYCRKSLAKNRGFGKNIKKGGVGHIGAGGLSLDGESNRLHAMLIRWKWSDRYISQGLSSDPSMESCMVTKENLALGCKLQLFWKADWKQNVFTDLSRIVFRTRYFDKTSVQWQIMTYWILKQSKVFYLSGKIRLQYLAWIVIFNPYLMKYRGLLLDLCKLRKGI